MFILSSCCGPKCFNILHVVFVLFFFVFLLFSPVSQNLGSMQSLSQVFHTPSCRANASAPSPIMSHLFVLSMATDSKKRGLWCRARANSSADGLGYPLFSGLPGLKIIFPHHNKKNEKDNHNNRLILTGKVFIIAHGDEDNAILVRRSIPSPVQCLSH